MAQKLIEIVRNFNPCLPPPDIVEWARESVFIGAKTGTARAGFYDVKNTPYMAEILRSMADESVRSVTLCTGSQVGKSQAMNVFIAYLLYFSPAPTMLVQPTKEEAAEYANSRVLPMFEDSDVLRVLVPSNKRKAFTRRAYNFTSATLHLRGAGSVSQLASLSIKNMILDETDKYPDAFTNEGDPISLLRQRLKTWLGQEKLIQSSTPTTKQGVIWQQYLLGDCREFEIKCESCGEWFGLNWGHVFFEPSEFATAYEIGKTAYLKCDKCGARFTSEDKNRMAETGRWVATKPPSISGATSFHLQSVASKWVTLEKLVEMFISAKRGGVAKLHGFINGELAEPWEDESYKAFADMDFKQLEKPYKQGESFPSSNGSIETKDRIRIVGADVQVDRLVAVCREFEEGGESGLVAKWEPRNFGEFLDFIRSTRADVALVDARYRTKEVLEFASREKGILPAYGSARVTSDTIWHTAFVDGSGGRSDRSSPDAVETITYNQSQVFALVVDAIQGKGAKWWIYEGASLDNVYTSQIKAKKNVAGLWQAEKGVDDHFADAEKLAMLGALRFGYLFKNEERKG